MTYELAKQLKNTGFPQKTGVRNYSHVSNLKIGSEEDMPYTPTLSELIESCGDRELELFIRNDSSRVCTTRVSDEDGTPIWFEGKTPEEAVAMLWLELNKK